MEKKNLSVWEAACIITGYGIGGGVLAMPYLAAENGIIAAALILLAAFGASFVLHMMIADVVSKCGGGSQIVAVFSRFLFRGPAAAFLTVLFFLLMAVVLCANLAAYIAGAADVLTGLLPVGRVVSMLAFYILAASVVFFGLKVVAVSEKLMVTAIFAIIGILAVFSLGAEGHALPLAPGGLKNMLAFFGMAMLSFSAFFSIPQAVEGLGADVKKVKKAVFIGLGNNFVLIVVITLCALYASDRVTEVAMVGWSAGIGAWASVAGAVFTLLAMLTTYWSISLALSSIVMEQTRLNSKLCWCMATLPSLLLALLPIGGFLEFLEIAGGAIAILVAVMVVPTYGRAMAEIPGSMLGRFSGRGTRALIIIAYLLMALGSLASL